MYPFSKTPDAIANLRGGSDHPTLRGNVTFSQIYGRILIVIHVYGLPHDNPSGFFALHIHEGDACSGEGFSDTKSHYNPQNLPHPEHAGDLPPLLSCNGEAYLAVLTDRFSIQDIVGKTVVIHSSPDDFHSQPAGNAGTKIACGVIYRV